MITVTIMCLFVVIMCLFFVIFQIYVVYFWLSRVSLVIFQPPAVLFLSIYGCHMLHICNIVFLWSFLRILTELCKQEVLTLGTGPGSLLTCWLSGPVPSILTLCFYEALYLGKITKYIYSSTVDE